MAGTIDYRANLLERLRRRSDGGAGLLNAALEEDIPTFLLALKDVVDARLGMTGLSRKIKLHRVSLHAALSQEGNPKLANLAEVLDALGLRLAVMPKEKAGRSSRRRAGAAAMEGVQ